MNNNEMKKIEERLTPPAAPEPPEGLLEKIQSEIPEHLHLVEERARSKTSPWRLRLIAASVGVVVLGGFLALNVSKLNSPSMVALEDTTAPMERAAATDRVVTETEPVDRNSGLTEVERENLAALGYIAGNEQDAQEANKAQVEQKRKEMLYRLRELPAKASEPESPSALEQQNRIREQLALERAPVVDERKSSTETTAAEESATVAYRGDRSSASTYRAGVPVDRSREYRGKDDYSDSIITRDGDRSPPSSRRAAQEEDPEARSVSSVREVPPGPEVADIAVTSEAPIRVEVPEVLPLPGQETAAPSTGGTHEPNDAPYGDMFFKSYGTNPFVDTEVDTQSTFGLDVDTGSYTLARSYIERGNLPPGEAIRVEEFVNYFDYGDPAPRRGEFTITAEGAPSPFTTGPRYYLVRFGIKGREISAAERKPAMLIFVVDVSGSMRRENRLGLVKRSLQLLLDQLQTGDQVGLVVYGNRGRVLLEPTSDRYAIERAIDQLRPSGSTNAEEGLTLAYDLARAYRRRGAINRIILCSDGVANVGRTGPDSILQRIQGGVDQGIELTTVGFGMGNYNDVLMEQLADKGDGSYAYVDTLDEARRIFVENLTRTLQTIASDAKIQVEFNPDTVSLYRLLGYENRDIADHRFRDDTVDAGEIGAGHEVTALYEIKLRENVAKRDRLATLRLRYRSKQTDQVVETAVDMSQKNFAKRWESASPALRLSSVVAEFAEILKGSHWAEEGSLDMLEQRVSDVAREYRGDQDVQDFSNLVEQARRLAPLSPAYGEED